MSSVTWIILVGALVILVLAAMVGTRSAGSPAQRLGARALEKDNREIIVSEVGIVVAGVLLGFGLLLESGFLFLLGFLSIAAALLRLVIHRGPAAPTELH